MKRNINIIAVLLISFWSCTKMDNPFHNQIYFANADASEIVKLSLDTVAGKLNLPIRAADIVGADVSVSINIDENALQEYNVQHGTNFQLLQKSNYSFSKQEIKILKGNVNAESIDLIVNPFQTGVSAIQYALPLTISSNDLPALNASKTIIVLINKVIFTSAPYLDGYQRMETTFKQPFNNLGTWTIEWRVKMDELNSNNQTLIGVGDEIYTRFGDIVINPTQMQVKTAGTQFSPTENFQAGIWYNLALVYDGANLKWYKNASLIMSDAVSKTYNFNTFYVGGGGGGVGSVTPRMFNEIRLWNIVRTPSQMANSFYEVNPDTHGLLAYWKCNDGAGDVCKDATTNGNDLVSNQSITWIEKVRMPSE